jgi:hypothetical protein
VRGSTIPIFTGCSPRAWMRDGELIPRAPHANPALRTIERLAEAVTLIKGLLKGKEITFAGRQDRVTGACVAAMNAAACSCRVRISFRGRKVLHSRLHICRARPRFLDLLSCSRLCGRWSPCALAQQPYKSGGERRDGDWQ